MEMVLPPSLTTRADMRQWGWKPYQSKALRVIGDVTSLEELRALQQDKDKTEVEAPSSSTILKNLFPTMFIMI